MKNEKEKEKPKGLIQSIWNKTDGWKTIAGFVLHTAWAAVHLTTKIVDLDTALWIHGGIGSITGVGTGHKISKVVKSQNGQKVLKAIGKIIFKK